MKICQVCASVGKGGLEKHVVELSNGLAETEEVTVVAHETMRQEFSKNVRFVPIDFTRSRYNPWMFAQFFRVLRDGNYDLVHAHGSKSAILVARMRRFLPGKIVATSHLSKKKRGRDFINFSHIICVSKKVQDALPPGTSSSIIYNGVGLANELPRYTKRHVCEEFGFNDGVHLCCNIARLEDMKGQDLLIQAFESLDAQLLIVGEGRRRQKLEDLIDRLNLSARVKLAGYRNDVQSLLAGVDSVVISSYHEGFPYAFIEALHERKLILSSDVAGPDEVLDSRLLTDHTSESIRMKLDWLIKNENQWHEYMESAWNRAPLFSFDSMKGQTLELYRAVSASRR